VDLTGAHIIDKKGTWHIACYAKATNQPVPVPEPELEPDQ
jgi:hypothetical protein